ncbi:AMP-binding protein [Halotalea alkalilenta]|uniref:AMP-binding protein n=1 Tax=Halotalea alkalilenta TaxID=376489 RepID=UPI0004849BDB|nr:AMP-binding protein [Halotalea alkalilenta]
MNTPWLESYPPGVPAEIDVTRFDSLVDMFDQACERYAPRQAYVCMGTAIDYRRLSALSNDFAAWLQAHGMGKGDRIALMMPNLLQYPVVLFGALRAGCVVVNCNPLYTTDELEHKLVDAEARMIVIAENFAHTLDKAGSLSRLDEVIVTRLGELLGPVKGRLVDFTVRRVKKLVPAWQLPGHRRLDEVLAEGRRHRFTPVTLGQDDLACLQYTGGTTGVAKGAMLSHGNLIANVVQASAWVRGGVREGAELMVTALPLYHIFALTANCLVFLHLGATNLLITNPRDIPTFVKTLKRYPFSCMTGVNTLFNALLNHPDFARLDFSHLKVVLGGGMAVQGSVAERWQQVTGKPITQAYGLTETSPAVTINPIVEPPLPFSGSIGLPIPSTEVRIRNEQGEDLGIDQVGELCVRGPQVISGYWKHPEEQAHAFFSDGFLRTGDIARMDAKGFFFLVERKKDMILVSGFNVYPNEVEEVATRHPGVSEAAAVGVADELSGERVKLFVIRRDPDLTQEMLIEHCRQHLSGYKVPRQIEFRDDLPRTNVGKILRRELRSPPSSSAAAVEEKIPD